MGTPNTTLGIYTYQPQLATLTTDSSGSGHIFLSTGDGTLPNGFPAILVAGEPISIGNASGVLADVSPSQVCFFLVSIDTRQRLPGPAAAELTGSVTRQFGMSQGRASQLRDWTRRPLLNSFHAKETANTHDFFRSNISQAGRIVPCIYWSARRLIEECRGDSEAKRNSADRPADTPARDSIRPNGIYFLKDK